MSDLSDEVSADVTKLTFGQAVRRGAGLVCPACGHGELFRNYFQMHSACPGCGFRYERPSGFFLGSTYINYGVTAFTVTVSYVAMRFGLGWDKNVLLPGSLIFCAIFPLVFFRFARSLWLSLDCFFDRAGASEAMSDVQKRESESEVENNDG